MNVILLIAKRFLMPRNMLEGGIINIISFIGLFIGAASVILSVAVLNGFQGILENETKKISFFRPVNPRVPKRVFLGWLNKCRNLKRKMGMNGVPFGPIGMKLCRVASP